MSTISRIHLSGLPPNATKEDVSGLISKVCPVLEVHIPEPDEWGFRRNFAVIRVNAEPNKVQNCIKSYNGSMWKGNKIRLDMAKEWYKDRLEREKQMEQELLQKQNNELQKDHEIMIDVMKENFSRSKLYNQQDLTASASANSNSNRHIIMLQKLQQTLPKLSHGAMLKIRRAKTMKSMKICSTPKIVYDNQLLVSKSANAICKPFSAKIVFDEDCFAEISQSEELVPFQEYQEKLKDGITAGGGAKKRDINSNTSKKKDEKVASKGKNSKAKDETTSLAAAAPAAAPTPKIGGKGRVGFGSLLNAPLPEPLEKRVDCCIDDDKICGKRSNFRNISEYDDFGPNSLEIVEIEDNTPCVPAELLEDAALEKERNRALEFAMSILKKAEEKQSTVAAKKQENNKRGQQQQQSQEKQIPQVLSSSESSQETKKNDSIANSSQVSEQPKPGNDGDGKNAQSGFINLNTFKNIFHKEGGVWWNDNEAAISGETHIRGSLENDVLFKAAEKMGFDIREPAGQSIFNFNVEDGNGAPAPEKTVLFNFFGESQADKVNPRPDVAVNDKTLESDRKRKLDHIVPKQSVISAKPVEVEIELIEDDIIVLAKQFCRESSLEEIEQTWRNEKDQSIADFKKRRRDAKRWSTQEKARRRNMLRSMQKSKKKSKNETSSK